MGEQLQGKDIGRVYSRVVGGKGLERGAPSLS